MPVPESLSITEAAAIPEVYLTAFQLLHFVADMKNNDNVLIHAGASGVGIAATQLAKLAHAGKVVTTSSTKKIQACLDNGADFAIDYTNGPFARTVKDSLQGYVNVVLDPVGGDHMMQSIHTCAPEARFEKRNRMYLMNIATSNLSVFSFFGLAILT